MIMSSQKLLEYLSVVWLSHEGKNNPKVETEVSKRELMLKTVDR